MNRRIIFLSGILIGQILLAGFLAITTSGVSGIATSAPLFNFSVKDIDRITIEQPNKTPLIIQRRANNWVIPALSDFPTLAIKVEGFFDRLQGLRKHIPIATTAEAIRRFKVSSDAYEYKISLNSGDKQIATLWLGDSPGLRQIHARVNDDTLVYNLDLAVHEINTDPNQWADKMALTIKSEEITAISLADIKLTRSTEEIKDKDGKLLPGKWQIDGLATGEEINPDAVDNFVNRLANLSFESVLGTENQTQYRQDAPVLTIALTMKNGERNYLFSMPQKEPAEVVKEQPENLKPEKKESEKPSEYILKVSTSPYYFKLAEFSVKDLLETTRAKLIKQPVQPAESQPAEPVPPSKSEPEKALSQ